MDPARDIHPNLRAHCYAPGKPGPGPGWRKRRRLQAEQIEADLAAALPNRPTALQRLLIERVAALTVEVRSLRARGKTGPEVISLDRAILVGVRQLGIGGALSGYSIQAQNARRSAARTGGNTDALEAFAEGLSAHENDPTPTQVGSVASDRGPPATAAKRFPTRPTHEAGAANPHPAAGVHAP